MSRGLRYRVTRKLAQGGMAEIFLAKQVGAEGFEKSVVLKRILPALAADPGFVRMLVDEAHIASTLNHGHLVQVLDLGRAEDQFFLALEFVDGFSLEQIRVRARKARLKLPLALSLYVVSALCRGLDYAHRRTRNGKSLGIVHRDVTPQNVLIGREGEVKLADFGIAKARGRREKSATGVIKGKFAYMSPEQSIGGELDARSDLFSVGTLLYVLTTGKKPFEGTTDLDVLMQVRRARYEKPSTLVKDFNPDVEKFIARALRADRSKRWQSAEQMADRLDAILFKLGQPTGPAALKRWLETLGARDGVRPPGDLRAQPELSNDTIQLTSQELELHEVGVDDDNELSLAPTQAVAAWKRVAVGAVEHDAGTARLGRKDVADDAVRADPPASTCVGAPVAAAAMCSEKEPDELDELLAMPYAEAESEADEGDDELDDNPGEYEFTLNNPIPGTGTTFTGSMPLEATEVVDLQTTVIVGQAPSATPAAALEVIDISAADTLLARDVTPNTALFPEPSQAEPPRRAPVDPTLVLAPIAPAQVPAASSWEAPRGLRLELSASERPGPGAPPRSLVARSFAFTRRAAAVSLLVTVLAAGSACALRPYFPPWLAQNPLVHHLDDWLARLPALSAAVSRRIERAR